MKRPAPHTVRATQQTGWAAPVRRVRARSSRGARALLALDLGGRFARAEDQLVRLLVRGLDRAELLSGGGGGGLRTGRGEGGGELCVGVLICAPTSSHSCESRESERVRVAGWWWWGQGQGMDEPVNYMYM